MAEMTTTYADLGRDAADASVVALTERFDLGTVATLDSRDFQVIKPARCDTLTLLPYHAGNAGSGRIPSPQT